jgi:pimeloyl-ACP methyl ester carboxylesterase
LLTVCGGPVCIYEAGDPENPAVVLLHGAMYDEARFIWDQLFPYLAKDYHVFAIDTPRHGRSRPWEGTLNQAKLLEILDGTFNALQLTHFSLVGLSMGGALAIGYAALYPNRVQSMVLFEPGGLGEKLDAQFVTWLYIKTPGMLRLLSKNYSKKDRAAILKLLNTIYVGGSSPTDPDRLVSILMDEIKGKFDNRENDMDDWQLSGVIGPFRLHWNLLDQIPRICCPTLWLRGAESTLVKQSEMERAVQLARENGQPAELMVVPHAGHILPLEQPDIVNPMVKEFLSRNSNA